MKRTLLAASLALVASGLLFAQEPADLAKSPAVQETQEVENELLEFPVDALTKSMNNSLSKKGLVLGGINNDGSIYMIGSATTARPSNMSGFINSRNVAFNIAEMTAKMNILRLAGEQITSGRGFTLLEDIIEGEDPDAKKKATMLQKAAKIADKSLDKALAALGVSEEEIAQMNQSKKKAVYEQTFNQTTRSLVAGMLEGCAIVRTAEGESGNNDYQVAVCIKYSPEFQEFARALKSGDIDAIPVKSGKSSRQQILNMTDQELLYKLGTWVTYDEQGNMVVYGFGQQEVRETGTRQSAAVSRASEQARLQAVNNIKNFVAEDLVAQETQESVEKLKEYADGSNAYFSRQKWEQAVQAKETTLNIATEQVRSFRAVHPVSNTQVAGYVVAWTYQNAKNAAALKDRMNNAPKKPAPAAGKEKSEPQKTTRGTIVVTGDDEDL